MFKNLHELIATMPDDKSCRDYLAKARWPDGKAKCPYCGWNKCYNIENGKRYKCGNSTCYKKFSVTVGTVFEASNIPLNKWFAAIYLCTAHKKGISSYQLGKDIGVSQKSAWFMLHRIREIMRAKQNVMLDNIVEIDEVYIGGKVPNMSKHKRTKLREEGNTYNTKTLVMGLIERGGSLKLISMGKDNGINVLQPLVIENVDKDAVVITDSFSSYVGLQNEFAAHEVVNHAEQEFVRDSVFHTNSIEGAFSQLRRSIYGIYHQVTPKHLSRYCDETMFRYNLRKMKDSVRFNYSLQKIEGRLDYKTLVRKNKETPVSGPVNTIEYPKGTILQLKYGKVIGDYQTITQAAKMTGLNRAIIWRVLNGIKRTTGGFEWKYA